MKRTFVLTLFVLGAWTGRPEIVAFKDAAKITSWDAWDDHKERIAATNVLQKEKRSVTWEKLNRLSCGLREIGRLPTRTSSEIDDSPWSVGCETMDRDYAVWDNYKALLPLLGVKHARFFSGWAKTEQEKGRYDFSWLDRQIRECAAMKVKPWVCISYGNPVWGSDFRLGMRVEQITSKPEALAAWLRYTHALVRRYRDVVDEWEIWNEPFDQAEAYATLFYETAKAVRAEQPAAKIICTAIAMKPDMTKSDYAVLLEKLKRENALDLVNIFAYHPYAENPDTSYEASKGQFGWQMALPLRRFVKGYSERYDIVQGETGCPSQLEFAHALANHEWTEYAQAKWNLRRAIGDAARGIPSSAFTMIDLQYTFMLQSFGLVRSNALKEFVYRRPSWYAMRNVYSLIDSEVRPVSIEVKSGLACAIFRRKDREYRFYWFSDAVPSSDLTFRRIPLADVPKDAVWVEMITGRVFALEDSACVPMWDSPILIASRADVFGPDAAVWERTFEKFFSKKTGLFYGRDGQDYEDCAILNGQALSLCVDRADAARAAEVARGLLSLGCVHGVPGYVMRGIARDGTTWNRGSSRDQITHYVHGLFCYYRSGLADGPMKAQIAAALGAVADRMLRNVVATNDWNALDMEGKVDARGVLKMWQVRPHEAARLPMAYLAAWKTTGEERYREAYERTIDAALEQSMGVARLVDEERRAVMPGYAFLQMNASLEVIRLGDPTRTSRAEAVMKDVAHLAARRFVTERGADGPWLSAAGDLALAVAMVSPFASIETLLGPELYPAWSRLLSDCLNGGGGQPELWKTHSDRFLSFLDAQIRLST